VGEHGDAVLVGIIDDGGWGRREVWIVVDGKSSVGICQHSFGKVDARTTYIK